MLARDAGISRATYYARLAQGMSHEDALSIPKGRRYITGPTMSEAMEQAQAWGIMGKSRPPSRDIFNRMRSVGVPAKLAVLAGRQGGPEGIEHARHIAELAADPERLRALFDDRIFSGGMGALLKHAHEMSGEQTKSILLNLARRLEYLDESEVPKTTSLHAEQVPPLHG